MIRLFPAVQPAVRSPLESVLGQALAAGAPPPSWVAVEDDNGLWIREAASAPPGERARGVLAARSEAGLVTAVRLGIGGALQLPPSTTAGRAALEAAAAVRLGAWPAPSWGTLWRPTSPVCWRSPGPGRSSGAGRSASRRWRPRSPIWQRS